MAFLLASLLLAVLVSSLPGAAARANALREPPAFHGFALGMTLDEMRAKAHSDKALTGARLACTGDSLAEESKLVPDLSPKDARAGVKNCLFLEDAANGQWKHALFALGGHKVRPLSIVSPKTGDPATSERLYNIAILIAPEMFDGLAGALKAQFGAPDIVQNNRITTSSGSPRDARRLAWRGGNRIVMLEEQSDKQKNGILFYVDLTLSEAVKQLTAAGGAIASPQPSAPKAPPWPIAKAPAANAANAAPAPQAPAATGGLPQPLGLRGFELGMTLAEVRKLRHPDPGNDKARLVCGGDPLAKASGLNLDPTGDTAAIGARLCRLYTVDNGKVVADAPMNVGGYDAEVFFTFAPASGAAATSERLFRIMVIANPVHFASLVEAYQTRFGKADIDETLTKDRLRPSRTLIWKNARSNLFLTEFMALAALPAERTVIAYTDAVLLQAIEDAAKKKKKSGADKL